MTNRLRTFRRPIIVALVVIFCMVSICAFSWRIALVLLPSFPFQDNPTDEQLIANYIQHKSEFKRLAELLLAEKDIPVILPQEHKCRFSNPRSDNDFEDENCHEYTQLINSLGLKLAEIVRGNTLFLLIPPNRAFDFGSGPYKMYVYTTKDFTQQQRSSACSHIEGNWYICSTNSGK